MASCVIAVFMEDPATFPVLLGGLILQGLASISHLFFESRVALSSLECEVGEHDQVASIHTQSWSLSWLAQMELDDVGHLRLKQLCQLECVPRLPTGPLQFQTCHMVLS